MRIILMSLFFIRINNVVSKTKFSREICIFSSHIYNLIKCLSQAHESVGHLTRKSEILGSIPGLAAYSFLLPLNQEGQLSVTGESMCTKYWLTA